MMPSYSPSRAKNSPYGDSRNSGVEQNFSQLPYQGVGFSFQKRQGRIDWKKLAAVDVDRIARDVDVQTLQDNIAHVAFCDVQNELSVHGADSNLVKLFRLAQLLIEYLLHSQEYLQGYISQIESQTKNAFQDQANLREEVAKKSNAYRNLKKEYQKNKKLIAEYQLMLRAGASGFHKCPFCSKSFLSDEFLKAHILRRHTDKSQNMSTNTQNAPPSFVDQRTAGNSLINQEELLKELGLISSKLQETEARLVAEREERDRQFEATREAELQRIEQFSKNQLHSKDEEITELKVAIENHKDMFLKEINELHSEKNSLQRDFKDLNNRTTGLKPSMLGELKDVSVDGHREEDISQIKEQLQNELMSSYQVQMEKSNKAARRREEQMKRLHTEEMEKVTGMVSKYEETLKGSELEKAEMKDKYKQEQLLYDDRFKRYEKMMEDQKMQMTNMEEILNSRRSRIIDDDEMLEVRKIAQEAVISSTPTTRLSAENIYDQDSGDFSEDTILLHVASNTKNSFRVWKTPSPASSEWKDSFTFRASTVERGQFNRPIYAYCAGGSPYWRQYISSSAKAPRPSYRLDFMFYVSSVQLMGTTRVYVLDAGSGEVVKSMMSKSEVYPGWKQKGLSFFVLKGMQQTNLTKSVSFHSTLNESEFESGEDVSVSSYTGTEDARKNLAAEIARSRSKENIVAAEKEEVIEKLNESPDEDSSAEPLEDSEVLTLDETDGNLATGSTSQWGSTLLQTGAFLPFPNNPLAVARYNHSKETINSYRLAAIEFLYSALEQRGLDPEARGMDETQFATKMNMHDNEVNVNARKNPGEAKNRKRTLDEVDRLARERLHVQTEEEPKGEKPLKSKFKSAVNKIRNAARFTRSSPKKKDEAKPKMRDLERTNSYINKSFDEHPPGNQDVPLPDDTPVRKQERDSDINDELFDDVSENSKWDSEVSSNSSPGPAGTVQMPSVTVTTSGRQTENIFPQAARTPRGENVRDLTASLEASLRSRDGAKKPPGAVDLHGSITRSLESPSQQQNDGNKDYDDDDDEFGLSSLSDEDYMVPPSKRKDDGAGIVQKPFFRADRDEAAGKFTQQSGSSSKLAVDRTAISKFSADSDFDSDSDLGL